MLKRAWLLISVLWAGLIFWMGAQRSTYDLRVIWAQLWPPSSSA